ncbi:MAG: hypothetical protein IJR94_00365 [Synergistaceae bacterium]|nr:hypothetical protein [Synergistaceae bacterium]
MAKNDKKNAPAPAPKDKKKTIIIAAICVIILLNIVWTVSQNKFSSKIDEVNKTIAALEQRVAAVEKGSLAGVDGLKEEFAALKTFADSFSDRLSQNVKAEEDQLALLEAQVEAQKARVEAAKKLAQ